MIAVTIPKESLRNVSTKNKMTLIIKTRIENPKRIRFELIASFTIYI